MRRIEGCRLDKDTEAQQNMGTISVRVLKLF